MPPRVTRGGTTTPTSPPLWENPLEGHLDEKCVFAPAGKIESSEWQENESNKGLRRLKLQIVFCLFFSWSTQQFYLSGSLTTAQCLLFLCIALIPPGLCDLTHDNNLTVEIKLLRLFAM